MYFIHLSTSRVEQRGLKTYLSLHHKRLDICAYERKGAMYIQWPNDKPKRLYDSRTDNHLILSGDYLESLTHLSDIMIGEKKRKRFSSVRHRLRNDLGVLIYIYIFY